jgi:hypothetical protein
MTKHIKTLLFSFAISSICTAEDTERSTIDNMGESPIKITAKSNRTNSKFEGLLIYSPIDLIIPSKFGLTFGYIENANSVWQLEYVRGSLSAPFFLSDLGKMTDQRLSLLRRSFMQTNSFYLSYGLSYMDFSTKLGNKYISAATSGAIPEIDILSMRSLGVQFSIGNQWHITKSFVAGVDWVGIYQPVFQLQKKSVFLDNTTDAELREDVDEVIKALSYIPRLTFLKIQLGMTF